jgi:hypothetical protein
MLLEEAAKGGFGVIVRVAFFEYFIIVGTAGAVVKNLEGLIDVLEASLSLLSVIFVEFGKPLMGQSLVGEFNLEGGGGMRNSEHFVVVLDCLLAHLIRYYCIHEETIH